MNGMTGYIISLTAVAAAVLLIRAAFRKTVPARLVYALWLIVVIRMIVPVSLFSVRIDMPEKTDMPAVHEQESKTQPAEGVSVPAESRTDHALVQDISVSDETLPGGSTASPSAESSVPPVSRDDPIPDTSAPETVPSAVRYDIRQILNSVWLAGAAAVAVCMLSAGAVFRFRLVKGRKFYKKAGRTKVFVSGGTGVPCLAGIIPSIYITPEVTGSAGEDLVISHEYSHMMHLDHIWAIVRVLALIVFWWNPLIWAAAVVSNLDSELACDETVVSKLDSGRRLEYADTLLELQPRRSVYSLGLGSGSIKERLRTLTSGRSTKRVCAAAAVILCLAVAGCSFASVSDKPAGEETQNGGSSEDPSEYAYLNYTVRKTEDGYGLYSNEDGALTGTYSDYLELRYYDAKDEIRTGHILVEENDGGYVFYSLSDSGISERGRFGAYSVYGDFIIADGRLFGGDMNGINPGRSRGSDTYIDKGTGHVLLNCDGAEISFTSVDEDGGSLTIVTENGRRTFFHMKRAGSPESDQDSSGYIEYMSKFYEYPSFIKEAVSSRTDASAAGAYISILFRDGDSGYRCMEIEEVSLNVFCGTDYPVKEEKAAYFRKYDAYIFEDGRYRETAWIKDGGGSFRAFGGRPYEACGGTLLVEEVFGAVTVDSYSVYNKDLEKIYELEFAEVLESGDLIGKPIDSDKVIVIGKDGAVLSETPYEKVIAVTSYGAVVADSDQLLFTDPSGNSLAETYGYRDDYRFWRQSSETGRDSEKIRIVFDVPGDQGDLVDFWYDPSNGDHGVSDLNGNALTYEDGTWSAVVSSGDTEGSADQQTEPPEMDSGDTQAVSPTEEQTGGTVTDPQGDQSAEISGEMYAVFQGLSGFLDEKGFSAGRSMSEYIEDFAPGIKINGKPILDYRHGNIASFASENGGYGSGWETSAEGISVFSSVFYDPETITSDSGILFSVLPDGYEIPFGILFGDSLEDVLAKLSVSPELTNPLPDAGSTAETLLGSKDGMSLILAGTGIRLPRENVFLYRITYTQTYSETTAEGGITDVSRTVEFGFKDAGLDQVKIKVTELKDL